MPTAEQETSIFFLSAGRKGMFARPHPCSRRRSTAFPGVAVLVLLAPNFASS